MRSIFDFFFASFLGPEVYESKRLLAEYLLLHYGSGEDLLNGLPGPLEAVGFPQRTVHELLDPSRISPTARALDLGCAVGASAFELARHCHQVKGIDFSQKFISTASILAVQGKLHTHKPIEGKLTASFTAQVPPEISRNRVTFQVGDAMNLPAELGKFDVVLAANLLCRLPNPQRFLKSLPSLVHPGGQLLLTTPFSWLEEFTPQSAWLGSKDSPGWEALKETLFPHFELEKKIDLPFLIREHARKFQYGISLGSRWIRRH